MILHLPILWCDIVNIRYRSKSAKTIIRRGLRLRRFHQLLCFLSVTLVFMAYSCVKSLLNANQSIQL